MKKQTGDTKRYVMIWGGILLLAVILGLLVVLKTNPREAKAEPTPEPTPEPTVTVTETPAPTPAPGITAIRLYAYGRELNQDGITLYVGDKPVELSAVIEPEGLDLPIGWTFSDQESVSMDVSSDGKTCKINVLKPSGRNDLTVVCGDISWSMPVYLWER